MNSIDPQIAILQTGTTAVEFALNWFLQSSLLIIAGIVIGRMLQGRGSAVQSAVYRTTLAAVLLCPLATVGLASLGFSGWSVQLPDGYQLAKREQPKMPAVDLEVQSESVVADIPEQLSSAEIPFGQVERIDPQSEAAFALPNSPSTTAATNPSVDTGTFDQSPALTVAEMWDFNIERFGLVSVLLTAVWITISGVLLMRLGLAWRSLGKLRRSAHTV